MNNLRVLSISCLFWATLAYAAGPGLAVPLIALSNSANAPANGHGLVLTQPDREVEPVPAPTPSTLERFSAAERHARAQYGFEASDFTQTPVTNHKHSILAGLIVSRQPLRISNFACTERFVDDTSPRTVTRYTRYNAEVTINWPPGEEWPVLRIIEHSSRRTGRADRVYRLGEHLESHPNILFKESPNVLVRNENHRPIAALGVATVNGRQQWGLRLYHHYYVDRGYSQFAISEITTTYCYVE